MWEKSPSNCNQAPLGAVQGKALQPLNWKMGAAGGGKHRTWGRKPGKIPEGAALIGIQKEEGPPGKASVLFVEYPRQPLFVLLSLEI